MYYNQRERLPVLLPVTVAEDGDARFYFDEALFRDWQVDAAWEEE